MPCGWTCATLRGGRWLDEHDRADAPAVAVISEAMARRRLPGLDPLGQRLQIGAGPLYTVVGVVGDVRQVSLASSEAVWSADAAVPIVRLRTLDDLLRASTAERRFALIVFAAFALAALLLAAAGIYGVLAGAVAERRREIGVRGALGAARCRILGLVVGRGMALTALGLALGTVMALLATTAVESLLYGVSRFDPITYLGVIALLAAVALAACGVPAWRALRVDPASALRAE